MKRTIRFTITTLWILLTRGYDAYATFQFTPDLSMEANPLVSVFGLSWSHLLIIIGLLSLYVIFAYYLKTFKPFDLLPQEPGYNMREMATYIHLGKTDSWAALFFKLPKSLKRFNHYMGHGMTMCLVFVGFVSTLMWLGLRHTDFYPPIHSATAIYAVILIGMIIIGIVWNRNMYRRYKAMNQTVPVKP